jgi:E3 ubiquitin-protein ligase SHPRH
MTAIVIGEHRKEEVAIARNAIQQFKAYIAEQSKSGHCNFVVAAHETGEKVDDLNKELDYFRTTFNRRVQYFAAYQIVSDSVSLVWFRTRPD